MGVADSSGAAQGQPNASHRQDFLYKNLRVNDLPTPVQSAVSGDRTETTKRLILGENRTGDPSKKQRARITLSESPDRVRVLFDRSVKSLLIRVRWLDPRQTSMVFLSW